MSVADKLVSIADNMVHVYAAGRDDYIRRFWKDCMQDGTRIDYRYAFYGPGWSDFTFSPPAVIRPQQAEQMFAFSRISDLIAFSDKLDFSQCYNFKNTFFLSEVISLPALDTTACAVLDQTFFCALKLCYIERLKLRDDGTQTFPGTFEEAYDLTTLTVEGCIGNDISFNYSNSMTRDSALSVLAALKDYSGTNTSHTCQFSPDTYNRLTAADKQIAIDKGWSL